MTRRIIISATLLLLLSSCERIDRYPDIPADDDEKTEKPVPPVEEETGIVPFTVADVTDGGVAYMWDESVIPEITIKVTKDEWNSLLKRYDEYSSNADFFHCNVTYKKGEKISTITDAGFRLRGNTSRRRPEGWTGLNHVTNGADWHHCHFMINFRKYHKDNEHTIYDIRKINLKWFKDDPCYVRELYCYDLFRRYGIWTAPFDTYCRLWIHVEGDSKPAYFGVYEMIEAIDEEFIERREKQFVSDKGNLWKCLYGHAGMADLKNAEDWRFSYDKNDGVNHTYEYKGDVERFEEAKAQFQDFITKLNGLNDEEFCKWIWTVCDVRLLLKTYAVNVAVGMWDDHWNNGNNFYLYFNSTDKSRYKVFFIPYDYDNTLGTSAQCGIQNDSGRHNPYNWGNDGILMKRLMKHDVFRDIYKEALKELIDPDNGLLDMEASMKRIRQWQTKISPYVSNDTDEDMEIYDHPAFWSNHPEYRLLDTGSNNFFKVKAEAIWKLD